MKRVLVIDNYDSFTYNLVHAVAAAGGEAQVVRNDALNRSEVDALNFDGIILSPGPGHPKNSADFGICAELINKPTAKPMLGVCLGMQGMALLTGGEVGAAPQLVHGEDDEFSPGDHSIFQGLPAKIMVGRYHSLCVTKPGPDWRELGRTADGTLMAMAHEKLPWIGLQFHPESILTPHGDKIMSNFLASLA